MTKRLENYRSIGLGLDRTEVQLSAPQPRWRRAFSDEAHVIFDQLRMEDLRLYHIGSTAIPGISSKPILDIMGSVISLAEFDSKKKLLEELGYECKGEYGIPGRSYSVLYNPEKTFSFVHLHVYEHSHPEVEKHLLFRDFLRANPEKAKSYEAEKLGLLAKKVARADYSEAKNAKITELLEDAFKNKPSSKVLAILGSAKGGANTKKFLDQKYPGATQVNLPQKNIAPYVYGEAEEDDFPKLVEQILESDLTVFATPVYWYAMSGVMKDFFDRLSHLMRGKYKYLGDAMYGKKFAVVVTGSDDRLPFGFEVPFASTAMYLGMDYLGTSYHSVGH